MPQIFEIFGYPIDDNSELAKKARSSASCPFLGADCDGGGNRHLSRIDLTKRPVLQKFFPDRGSVHAGVCSIQLSPGTSPWIVCPRRLLALRRSTSTPHSAQKLTEKSVLAPLPYGTGTRLGVWPEVKFKYGEMIGQLQMSFDYTLDYVVIPIGRSLLMDVKDLLGWSATKTRNILQKAGYSITHENDGEYVDDWPEGSPSVIEVMTSSTSGGNKKHRTTIPMAFEDAILGDSGKAPGINYRQVWARMVSQLIVKSEMALAWGGVTLWVVQDVLVDYICASTALNLHKFVSTKTSDVNMLALSYKDLPIHPKGVLGLQDPTLYSGLASANPNGGQSFEDMIHTPIKPPLRELLRRLAKRRPATVLNAP